MFKVEATKRTSSERAAVAKRPTPSASGALDKTSASAYFPYVFLTYGVFLESNNEKILLILCISQIYNPGAGEMV